jgi:anti-sigma factor RsiW
MSTCDRVRPQLSGYVDRHLDAAQAGEVRAHLLSCDACRGIADDLGLLRDAARQLGPIDPPAHVWLEIAGRVRLDSGKPDAPAPVRAAAAAAGRARADQWQWLGLAAALLLTTLAVYSIATPDSTAPVAVTTNTTGNAA